MAEEADGPEAGSEFGVDPAAMAVALGSASRDKADRFLEEQTALAADQRRHLHEQFKQLRLSIWQQRMGVVLRVATGFMGLAVAAGLAFMVWEASRSNGLLIEPFSVPPDLAARGLSGEVVAAKLLDRLTSMQAETDSARPAKSFTNNWGEHGIKLDIPETGISLTELDEYLRARLGSDIHVSGEIVRTDDGISLTARAGDQGADSITGKDAEMDALVQRLAESVYRLTQPFRYGMYLAQQEREDEALPIFERLAKSGSKDDRLWSYNRWGVAVADRDGPDAGIALLKQAIALDPDSIGTYDNLSLLSIEKSRPEQAVRFGQVQLAKLADNTQIYVTPDRIPERKKMAQARIDAEIGAFHDAAPVLAGFVKTGYPGFPLFAFLQPLVVAQIGMHDLAAARATLADYVDAGRPLRNFDDGELIELKMPVATDTQDWTGVLAQADAVAENLRKFPVNRFYNPTTITPLFAYAQARLGRIAEAETAIAATPADCDICLRIRARIAELKNERGRADYWFARAVAADPSIPFAEAEWGVAILARGSADSAIEKFKNANQKSPHFADPLEGWGEALMAKKDSGAAAKFAEAEKYAPNWGRLHLKWGEALVYAGQKDEAQKQFALAAGLDLSSADKAELTREKGHG